MDIKLKEVYRTGTGSKVNVTFDLYDGAKSLGACIIVNRETAYFMTKDSLTDSASLFISMKSSKTVPPAKSFTMEEMEAIVFQMRRMKEKIHYDGDAFTL